MVHYVVLDEADCMLELGFEHQVRRLLGKVNAKHQSLGFIFRCEENEFMMIAMVAVCWTIAVMVTPTAEGIGSQNAAYHGIRI
eukprot:s3015_g9.t1